jgi:uncharacterized delta-60 repeat protein
MKTKQLFIGLLLRFTNHLLPQHVFGNFMKGLPPSKFLPLLMSLAVLAAPTVLMAQPGTLDPLFGTNGIASTANTVANAAALQTDCKIVVAGSISVQNFQEGGLLRYDTKGHLDVTFGTGGQVLIGGSGAGAAFAVAIQTDGKILAAAPDNVRLTVFRLNGNGSPDNTFGNNGIVTILAAGLFFPPATGGLLVQPDGRILVATGKIAARLLANGQLDSTFGSNGVAPTVGGDSVALLANGDILIGTGSVASLYSPNGTIVKAFGINGQTPGFLFNDDSGGFVVTTSATGVTKIITAGSLTTFPSLTFAQTVSGFLLVSYNTDGTVDNSFGHHGGVVTSFPGNILAHAFAVAVQRNGDIVAAGQTALTDVDAAPGPSDFGLVRYSPNGGIDTTFGNGGFVSTPFGTSEAFANTVLIQTDGKIVAVGSSNSGASLARYLGN